MIQEKSYYIIKVETKAGCYYKIGEGYKISRPNKLIEKYSELRSNSATLLLFETLPHNNKKRLNDKTIHSKIDSSKMKKADPNIENGQVEEIIMEIRELRLQTGLSQSEFCKIK